MRSAHDRGAAAVEFALVLLPLTLLTFGIIYFGYAFHLQTMLDNAARDAVRYFTLSEPADAVAAGTDAATNSLAATALASNFSIQFDPPSGCAGTEIATATITSTKALPLTGLFGWDLQLQGSGSMRCTG
jgi:Flp pilus assembly protein TadG